MIFRVGQLYKTHSRVTLFANTRSSEALVEPYEKYTITSKGEIVLLSKINIYTNCRGREAISLRLVYKSGIWYTNYLEDYSPLFDPV